MTAARLRLAYVPLTDAAPLIVAAELGFAAEEGLSLDLVRAESWAHLRDILATGMAEAAHMLAPVPVAQAMGLGPALPPLHVLQVLSLGGQVICVGDRLARAMRAHGHPFDFRDAQAAAQALAASTPGPLTIAVPFSVSTHAVLLDRWLRASGMPPGAAVIQTVPPPLMAEALAGGAIDAFCVGEPWGSVAVEHGAGTLLLPGRAIWASAPDKVLAARADWLAENPGLAARLMRVVWRAGRWLDLPGNRGTAAELVAGPAWLNLPAELAERALTGRFVISASGEQRDLPGFLTFHDGAATFPWKSLAALFAQRLAERHGRPEPAAMSAAMRVYRTDLYRDHLRAAGADLPGASAKVEGTMDHPTAVASERGQMILGPDRFFDGSIFEPPAD